MLLYAFKIGNKPFRFLQIIFCEKIYCRLKYCLEVTSSQIICTSIPSSENSRITLTDFFPGSLAFWSVTIVLPSMLTVVVHFLPSVVVSSKAFPTSKLISVDFKVVLVKTFHLPPDSVISMVGVEEVAAFLINMPRPNLVRNSLYFSSLVRRNVPVICTMMMMFDCY